MNYNFSAEDLGTFAMIMDEPGFQVIEKAIAICHRGYDSLSRISGEPFADGVAKGKASMLLEVLLFLSDTKKDARNKSNNN